MSATARLQRREQIDALLAAKPETGEQWAEICRLEKEIQNDSGSVFPISPTEAEGLSNLGWSSGFGWETDYDWFHEPSSGPSVFVDEDEALKARWLDDLAGIRRDLAHEHRRTMGAELFDALEPFVTAYLSRLDPGHWDLDNEQPHHVTVTLGDCRRARSVFKAAMLPPEEQR